MVYDARYSLLFLYFFCCFMDMRRFAIRETLHKIILNSIPQLCNAIHLCLPHLCYWSP